MGVNGIVFFARDPGAANLLKDLFSESTEYAPTFFAKDFARDVLKRARIPYRDFNAEAPIAGVRSVDRAQIRAWASSLGSQLIVTGTSHYDDLTDRLIWEECSSLGILTAAVLDQWIRLRERFVLDDGSLWRPDVVFAPDQATVERLRDLGIPRRRAEPLPLPHLSKLFQSRSERRAQGQACRADLEARYGRKIGFLAVFVSEPQSRLSAQGSQFDDVRLDEFSLYDDVSRAFASLGIADGLLLVKQHPKEKAGAYAALTPYAMQSEVDNLALASAADLLIGTKSMLLIEAAVLGKPTLSLEYACAADERLITVPLGLSLGAKTREEIASRMAEASAASAAPSGRALLGLGLEADWRSAWRSSVSRLWDEAGR